jgi:hypothetical protein
MTISELVSSIAGNVRGEKNAVQSTQKLKMTWTSNKKQQANYQAESQLDKI